MEFFLHEQCEFFCSAHIQLCCHLSTKRNNNNNNMRLYHRHCGILNDFVGPLDCMFELSRHAHQCQFQKHIATTHSGHTILSMFNAQVSITTTTTTTLQLMQLCTRMNAKFRCKRTIDNVICNTFCA